MATEMGLATVAGATAAAFLHLDKISRFKGAGFEAEMKKAVEQAYATIDEMKKVSKPLILTQINMLVFHGGYDGMDNQKKMKFFEQLGETAKMLSLDKDCEYNDAKELFIRYHTWDLFGDFIEALSYNPIETENQDEIKQFNHEKGQIIAQLGKMRVYDLNNYPTKAQICKIIKPIAKYLNVDSEKKLEDYEHYRKIKS